MRLIYCMCGMVTMVAPLALGCGKRSTQPHIQHVENPRRGCRVVVTPENSDIPGATGAASAQQDINLYVAVASNMAILSVAISSSRRTDRRSPAQLQYNTIISQRSTTINDIGIGSSSDENEKCVRCWNDYVYINTLNAGHESTAKELATLNTNRTTQPQHMEGIKYGYMFQERRYKGIKNYKPISFL